MLDYFRQIDIGYRSYRVYVETETFEKGFFMIMPARGIRSFESSNRVDLSPFIYGKSEKIFIFIREVYKQDTTSVPILWGPSYQISLTPQHFHMGAFEASDVELHGWFSKLSARLHRFICPKKIHGCVCSSYLHLVDGSQIREFQQNIHR